MAVKPPSTLNHFSLLAFSDSYWMLNQHAKASFHEHWLAGLTAAATNFDIYQTADSHADVLVWCALSADQPEAPAEFFEKLALITTPYRHLIRPVETLWGFSRASGSGAVDSLPEIDPFAATRLRYLAAYPCARPDANAASVLPAASGHSEAVGPDIGPEDGVRKLTLCSFGLADQQDVAIYETDDLLRLSDLLNASAPGAPSPSLGTVAPLYTAIYRPAPHTLALWR